jgi:hypothetical protein
MKLALDELAAEAELQNGEIATVLDLSEVAIINKRAGRRKWTLNEAAKLVALISARVGRRVSIEEAFEGSGIEPSPEPLATTERS